MQFKPKPKCWLAMKLTVILLTCALLQASAEGFSQNITVSGWERPLKEVLSVIEKQSDYVFFYNNRIFRHAKPVSLKIESGTVQEALDACLEGQDLSYLIEDKTILIFREKQRSPGKQVEPPGSTITNSVQPRVLRGIVTDTTGAPLPGVSVVVKGSSQGASTNLAGQYELQDVPEDAILVFSMVGFETAELPAGGGELLNVQLKALVSGLEQVVVVGYGQQKEKNITSSVATIQSEELGPLKGGSGVGAALVGKVPGLVIRQASGRPGGTPNIQIRNMGGPLFVIDGVKSGVGDFNMLNSNMIESISVLKDAGAAAVYGSQAANGVIIVKTKGGQFNTDTKVGVNVYTGWQNVDHFMTDVLTSGYEWNKYAAEAQLNENGSTSISPEVIEAWKNPDPDDENYWSFNWPDFILHENAPKTNYNVHASGGGENTRYYFSYNRLDQGSVFGGEDFTFNRNNFNANITSKIGDRLQVGAKINARTENRSEPGIPFGDKYNSALLAVMFMRPMDHPYANNNPRYPNVTRNDRYNAGLWTKEFVGGREDKWQVFNPIAFLEFDVPVDGLTFYGQYSHIFKYQDIHIHEFSFDTYTYDPDEDVYEIAGGTDRAFAGRHLDKRNQASIQGRLEYQNTFGKHNLFATLGTEWENGNHFHSQINSNPPINAVDLIKFDQVSLYTETMDEQARISYIGRFSYNYDAKYYLELAGSQNAAWRFAPGRRWGFFPSASVGWRITNEPFLQDFLGNSNVLTDLKLRASYGRLGNDNIPIGPFAYLPGYNFDVGKIVFDGELVSTIASRGVPTTNVTWFTSEILNVGLDFSLFNNKLTGAVDYFNRRQEGLLGNRYDVVVPAILGYSLPSQNQNSNAVFGGDLELMYRNHSGELKYNIRGTFTYARNKDLHTFNPTFGNAWDEYKNSTEERYSDVHFSYKVIGQFQSQEEINDYPVDIDGQGNTTLLPGDFIYEDVNKDGFITDYDRRPAGVGSNNPIISGSLGFHLSWKGFDFDLGIVYGGLFDHERALEARVPFHNNGNLHTDYLDRWRRADPYDPNSEWIPGKYPPLRFNNPNLSSYRGSTFWLKNVTYAKLKNVELGYTLPQQWTSKALVERARIYVSGWNLLTVDNLPSFQDPTITKNSGVQYPQMRYYNVGVDLTF